MNIFYKIHENTQIMCIYINKVFKKCSKITLECEYKGKLNHFLNFIIFYVTEYIT